MTTSTRPTRTEPVAVRVTPQTGTGELGAGRSLAVPTEWFPRLAHGTPAEWANHELTYDGIHWPDLNEDVAVDALLRGERSGESMRSIKRWLDLRHRGRREPIPQLPLPPQLARDLGPPVGAKPPRPHRGRRAG